MNIGHKRSPRDTRSHPQVASRAEPAARGWGEASSKNRSVGSCLRATPASARFFAVRSRSPTCGRRRQHAANRRGREYLTLEDDEPVLLSLAD